MAERLGHRPGLDGLRGLAVVLVMLGHFDVPFIVNGGLAGVTLFFVLSGFLITTLLMEEDRRAGTIDLARFYLRRARRLFPALVVVLAVAAIWMPWSKLQPVAFYYGNWSRTGGEPQVLGFLGHTWSLAIEEQFYLAWPLVMLFAPRHAKRIAVVGIGVAVALRFAIWQGPENASWIYFSTLTRIDAILAGCLLALSSWRPRNLWLPLAGLVTLATITDKGFTYEWGFTLAAALSVIAVSGALYRPGVLAHPVLRWFGRRSYGLYLWHGVFVFGLRPDGVWDRAGLAVASLVVAEASWWLVERWWLRKPTQAPSRERYSLIIAGGSGARVAP